MPWLAFIIALLAVFVQSFHHFAFVNFAVLNRAQLAIGMAQFASLSAVSVFGLLGGYVLFSVLTSLAGTRWGLCCSFLGTAAAGAAIILASNFSQCLAVELLFGFFTGGALPALIQTIREFFPAALRPALIGLALFIGPASSVLNALPRGISSQFITRPGLAWLSLPLLLAGILTIVAWPAKPHEPSRRNRDLAPSIVSVAALSLAAAFVTPLANNQILFLMRLLSQVSAGSPKTQAANMAIGVSGTLAFLVAGVLASILVRSGFASSTARAALLTVFGCLVPVAAFCGWKPEISVTLLCITAAAFHACTTLLYSGIADAIPTRFVSIGAAFGSFMISLFSWLSLSTTSWALLTMERSDAQTQTFAKVFLPTLGVLAAIGVVGFCLMAWFVPTAEASIANIPSDPDPAAMAASA